MLILFGVKSRNICKNLRGGESGFLWRRLKALVSMGLGRIGRGRVLRPAGQPSATLRRSVGTESTMDHFGNIVRWHESPRVDISSSGR